MVYGLEIPVAYIFSGLEKGVNWIKKKIFQETDFDDKMKKKNELCDFIFHLCPAFREKFERKISIGAKNLSVKIGVSVNCLSAFWNVTYEELT